MHLRAGCATIRLHSRCVRLVGAAYQQWHVLIVGGKGTYAHGRCTHHAEMANAHTMGLFCLDKTSSHHYLSMRPHCHHASQVAGYTAAAVAKAGGSLELQTQSQPARMQRQGGVQHQELGALTARDGVTALHAFMGFLLSLTNADADGRVILEPAATPTPMTTAAAAAGTVIGSGSGSDTGICRDGRLRYVLLNAARHFGRLLCDARAVLLVSGTLAPVDGLRAQLFPGVQAARLRHFECDHVVPADALLAVAVGRGPSGRPLVLRHLERGEPALIDELGALLLNLASVVPQGLVVFAPSFSYLDVLAARWESTGLMARLHARKQIFR